MSGDLELRGGKAVRPVEQQNTPRELLNTIEQDEMRLQNAALVNQPDGPLTYRRLPATVRSVPKETPVWRIELHDFAAGFLPLGLDIAQEIVVGRWTGPSSAVDLDLDTYGGFARGVSRRHAMLRPTPDGVYLIDLQSTNGTLHNSVRLGPGIARRLNTGDVISFGALSCTVTVIGRVSPDSPG